MKKIYLVFTMALMSFVTIAQTADVQIIHNSPDAAAAEVDIYVDGALALDDVAFRTATAFIPLPADTPISIAVAPGNSTGVGDAIATFTPTLNSANTYVIIATGTLSGVGYSPFQPFNLEIFDMGQQTAAVSTNTDVLVYHGATDAPTVDIVEVDAPAGIIVDDISYSEFQGYLELPTANYALEVTNDDGSVTVGAYEAPLEDLGLEGVAIVAVASGFLNPADNSDGAAFGIWVALPAGGPMVELPASTARAQIIHNAADTSLEEVDVYINGTLALDDFVFRTATPFIDLPASVAFEVAIAKGSTTSVADAFFTTPVTLGRNESYTIIADGVTSPVADFTLAVYDMAQEEAALGTETDVLIHHGSYDAPTVDIVEVGAGAGIIVDDISYLDFQGYLPLPTDNYAIQVTDDDGTVIVAAYEAPLADLGLDGAAIVAVASGFLNPADFNNGPSFGIWVALADGGPLVELPTTTARAQIIHNSADALAEVVDVYVNGNLAINDFAFRTATPFIDLPASAGIEVAVAPRNSTSVADAIATLPFVLERNATYIIVADGIVSPTGYDPAPPFSLEVYDMGQEAAAVATNTDVLVHHGATDAPTVDVAEVGVGAGTIVDDISYTEFQGYLELATENYILQVQDETGANVVQTYAAPLADLGLDGAALVIIASGFLDPSNNSDGAGFGLWVALPAGGGLIELPITTVLGANDFAENTLVVFPNPVDNILYVGGEILDGTSYSIYDLTGRLVVESSLNVSDNSIDMSAISQGIYQLVLSNDGNMISTQKILKK